MNKDKMIKKMAIDLVDEIDYSTGIYGDSVEEYAVVYFDYDHTAKNMVEKGYCKVAEDETVIKKSELARLKNLEINYEQVYEDYRKLETTNKRLEQEVKSLESGLELLQQKYEELGVEIAKHSCAEHSPNEPTMCVIDYITIPFQRLAIPRLHFSEWQSYEE